MSEMCTDNRFELIEKYKAKLIEATNIETSQDEMYVIDNILFRFWQMGWLDRLEQSERKKGKWIDESVVTGTSVGGAMHIRQYRCSVCGVLFGNLTDRYCYNCGARMEDEP